MSYFVHALRRSLFVRLVLVLILLSMPAAQVSGRWATTAFAGASLPTALPQASTGTAGDTTGTQDGQSAPGTQDTVNPVDTPSQCTATTVPPPRSFTARPGQAQKMTNDEATLDVGGEAVTATTVLTITPLIQT